VFALAAGGLLLSDTSSWARARRTPMSAAIILAGIVAFAAAGHAFAALFVVALAAVWGVVLWRRWRADRSSN
jgi:ABC-type multidrug transport system permease subunit